MHRTLHVQLHLKSIFASGSACACTPAVDALHTDSQCLQCLPVSRLLIISTLATAKPRAEPEAEPDAKGTRNILTHLERSACTL
jgi:hypothetical protein